jgi:hypothetical protein
MTSDVDINALSLVGWILFGIGIFFILFALLFYVIQKKTSSKIYKSPCKYIVGQQVPILYDRTNPERMVIENETGFKLFVIIFAIIGGVLALGGAFCLALVYLQ